MISSDCFSGSFGHQSRIWFSLAALTLAFALTLTACSDEVSTGIVNCTSDYDCPLGTVCGAGDTCVEASCEFCTDGQICYITDANPAGTCSAPECASADDCPVNVPCNGGVCGGDASGTSCDANNPCPQGKVCNWAGNCVDDSSNSGDFCDTHGDCETGEFCDPNSDQCLPAVNCDTVECGANEVCIEPYGTCQFDCNQNPDACGAGEYCHAATGACRTNNCPNLGPDDCGGTTPHFDATGCACVACLGANDCPAGHACNGGTCEQSAGCTTPCSADDPGVCGSTAGTPYCINNCCVECLGAADCGGGELCIDGFCGHPPNCATDPDACPTGYDCVAGECQPPSGGQSCATDPSVCPIGTFCNPDTETCEGFSGDGCGLCNPDCTCPNGLSCDMFVCTGCEITGISFPDFTPEDNCPSGQSCNILGLMFGFPICI